MILSLKKWKDFTVPLLSSLDLSEQKSMRSNVDQVLPQTHIELRKIWCNKQDLTTFWWVDMHPKTASTWIKILALASTPSQTLFPRSLLRNLDMCVQLNKTDKTCWCCLTNLSPSSVLPENASLFLNALSPSHYKETLSIPLDSLRSQTQVSVVPEERYYTQLQLRWVQENLKSKRKKNSFHWHIAEFNMFHQITI
jgi:hypothetical protein